MKYIKLSFVCKGGILQGAGLAVPPPPAAGPYAYTSSRSTFSKIAPTFSATEPFIPL